MQPIKKTGHLTTTIPTGLVTVMVIALTLRIGVKTWDKNHPPSTRSGIVWHDLDYLEKLDRSSKKLLLIDFTADWCRPCKVMEKTTFLNRTVTEMATKDFEAIKVVDRQVEEKKNPQNIDDLQNKYSLYGFPTVVVALPDKSLVDKQSGVKTPKEFQKFLADALKKADFVRAKVAMYDGRFEQALKFLGDCNHIDFARTGISHSAMVYWHVLNSLHKEEDAKKVVADAEGYFRTYSKPDNDDSWPLPMFRYMREELTEKQFLSKAKSKYEQTDAHCCIGLSKLQHGEKQHAIKEFNTVLRTGYTYAESYQLIQNYLDKLAPQDDETSDQ